MHEEITLTPSKMKHVLMLLVAALFVVVGIWVLPRRATSFDIFMAYAWVIFFGLGGLVFAAQLLPGCSFLKIRGDGFEFRALWRGSTFRWSDVQEFGVAQFTMYHSGIPQKHKMVGIRFSPSCQGHRKHLRLRRLNEALLGYEAALPDNYGMKHDDLAELLNRKKAEYGGRS